VIPEAALLCADVGGTTIGAGAVTASGAVQLADEVPTLGGGPGSVVETLLALLQRVQARAPGAGLTLTGCGIGVAAPVDVATGRVGSEVYNLPELAGSPLRDLVAARTGLATVVDNDVNALTLGEVRFGVARGCRSAVVLALGTGVGGGVYVNGGLVRGASGHGGELGHVTVDLDGRACVCGSRGCLKAYVAGPDIAAQAAEAGLTGPAARGLTAPEVFAAAEAGDAAAGAVVERVCRALGAALGGILNAWNPEAVLLTGGVALSLEGHLEAVRRWARAYAFEGAYRVARLELVRLTKATTIRGAAALYLSEAAPGVRE
jgi:glucokinase